MKLIIIEGTDRTGKDTLVKGLTEYFAGMETAVMIKHWGFPIGRTNEEKNAYQKESFRAEFGRFNSLRGSENMAVIWNRAHLGEMVYGPLYRQSDPKCWIIGLEEEFRFDKDPEIFLIYIKADPEFLINHDDGKSFSNELVNKQMELRLFREAYESSKIMNKLMIKVNEKDEYIEPKRILDEAIRFITQS